MAYARTGGNLWQDWVNLVLGAWLFVSPWALGYYALSRGAAWNAWIFGIVIGVVAVAAIVQYARWQEWVNLIVGLWVLIAPWGLAFTMTRNASWDHVVVGVLVAAFSIWSMAQHRARRVPV